MHFKLVDGNPVWALAMVTVGSDQDTFYLYDPEELEQYPEHVLLDSPSPEILARAAQIQGMTYSRTEFERLLHEKTSEELLREQNAQLLMASAQQSIIIQ